MPKLVALTLALAVLSACGGGAAVEEAQQFAEEMSEMTPAERLAASRTPVQLSESDMKNFVAVMTEMQALADSYDDASPDSDIAAMGMGLEANAEAMKILRKHDMTVLRYQQVTHSVMAALAASEMEGREEETAAAQAQMEAMKSSMGEEQYKAMMETRNAMLGTMTDQPEGNVELVKRWRDRLDALGDS